MEIDQEIMQKLENFNHKSEYLKEQMDVIGKQVIELSKFKETLKSIRNEKEKEILAPLGKGVYVKADMKSDKLFIEVGSGIVVRKSIEEAEEIITEQSKKLEDMQNHLVLENENLHSKIESLIKDFEKKSTGQTI